MSELPATQMVGYLPSLRDWRFGLTLFTMTLFCGHTTLRRRFLF